MKLSVACPKAPSKVRILGARDLCAPKPQKRKKKGNTRTKKNEGKQTNTQHTQRTRSTPASDAQVRYMPCNATLRPEVKHDDNRTDKDYQEV